MLQREKACRLFAEATTDMVDGNASILAAQRGDEFAPMERPSRISMDKKASLFFVSERLQVAFIHVVHATRRDVQPVRNERVKLPPIAGFAEGSCHAGLRAGWWPIDAGYWST